MTFFTFVKEWLLSSNYSYSDKIKNVFFSTGLILLWSNYFLNNDKRNVPQNRADQFFHQIHHPVARPV